MTDPGGLEVLATGPLTLVQDLGRPGWAAIGVSRSGAADRGAFRLGARLLAQDYAAAALEVTAGGLVVRARGSIMMALTGADAYADVDGHGVGGGAPFELWDGQTLRLGRPAVGLRTYLSVRGGIAVPPVLGSRATDMLSGLGPPPVRVGDLLPVGRPPARFPNVDLAPGTRLMAGPITLRAEPGPRAGWLADLGALAITWRVSARSDRVGIRLEGPRLDRVPELAGVELPSEGVVRGGVQVPAGGEPIIFLADHPVTGGYPVVAVVREDDQDLAAQAVPGQQVQITLS